MRRRSWTRVAHLFVPPTQLALVSSVRFRGVGVCVAAAAQGSGKNFQLTTLSEPDDLILQFGKDGPDRYTMDFCWPLAPMQVRRTRRGFGGTHRAATMHCAHRVNSMPDCAGTAQAFAICLSQFEGNSGKGVVRVANMPTAVARRHNEETGETKRAGATETKVNETKVGGGEAKVDSR